MNIKALSCPACGAPVHIRSDTEHIKCEYCSCGLIVQRKGGILDLAVVQQFKAAVDEIGEATQETIRQSTEVTQAELRRLQTGQKISALQIQMAGVQTEIRALEREKRLSRKSKRRLRELREEEQRYQEHIHSLESSLGIASSQAALQSSGDPEPASLARAFFFGTLTFILVFIGGFLGVAILFRIFGGYINGLAGLLVLIFAIYMSGAVYVYMRNPTADRWHRYPRPLLFFIKRLSHSHRPTRG